VISEKLNKTTGKISKVVKSDVLMVDNVKLFSSGGEVCSGTVG
jgi:hypothetical protein